MTQIVDFSILWHESRLYLTFSTFVHLWQSGNTALNVASLHGRTGVLKVLLEAGADIEAKDNVSRILSGLFTRI
jgi:hypothetical protein